MQIFDPSTEEVITHSTIVDPDDIRQESRKKKYKNADVGELNARRKQQTIKGRDRLRKNEKLRKLSATMREIRDQGGDFIGKN